MPKLSWVTKTLAWLSAAVLLLLGWRMFQQMRGGQVLDMLGENAARIWTRPYFQIGTLPVTPAFLVKTLVFLIALAFVASRFGKLLRRLADRSSLDQGQRYAIERTGTYLFFLLGLLVGLDTAGVNLSSLAVIGGALGIGIGFGMQSIMNNFVSGLILLFERPVKVGDRVEIDRLDGTVVRIGARATWVRTNDNIVIVLPNSEFVVKPVVNWTANNRQVRFRVPIGVSYKSSPETVRRVLLRVAAENTDVLADPGPDVVFLGFGDSSLDFELRVWTQTMVDTYPVLKSDLYFAAFKALAEAGIEIPYPQRDLHLRSSDVALTR